MVVVLAVLPGAAQTSGSSTDEELLRSDSSLSTTEGPATAEIAWIRQFGTSRNESADGVAVDADGNVYVVGNGRAETRILPGCIKFSKGNGGEAYANSLRKYDAAGNVLWIRENESGVSAVAADTTGVYVTGPGYVRKYDIEGNPVWTQNLGGPLIAVDGTGVYLTGYDAGGAFLAKLNLDGDLVWIEQGGGLAEAIALVPSGLYLAGSFGDSSSGFLRKVGPDGKEIWIRVAESSLSRRWVVGVGPSAAYLAGYTPGQLATTDMFLRKYDGNGDVIWTRQFEMATRGSVSAAFVDDTGVYIAGTNHGVLCPDAFVQRLNFVGNEIWTRQLGTFRRCPVCEDGWETGHVLVVNGSGVYVAGSTSGMFLEDPLGPRNYGGLDGYVAKLVQAKVPPTLTRINATPAVVIQGRNVTLSATASDLDGAIVHWRWDFGDGSIRNALAAPNLRWFNITETHTYAEVGSYTVNLTVDFLGGSRATETVTVRVVAPLSLQVSAESITGTIPLTVSFVASPSGGVPPYSFVWDFGDNSFENYSSAQTLTHTYEVAGTYDVSVTVTDAIGQTASMSAQVTANAPNAPPAITAVTSVPVSAILGQQVTWTVTLSDPDGDSLAYRWDFGDGSIATGVTPPGGGTITATHSYAAPGAYTVTLSVDDGKGGRAAAFATVRVTSPGLPQWVLYALVAAVAVGIGGVILWRWRARLRTPRPPSGSS